MPRGISLQEAAARLAESGIRLSDRYQRGASGKGSKWASATGASEQNYNDGIQKAIAAKSFSKGISEAGAGAYDQGVSQKGVLNWPTGMQFADAKYQKKTGKFAALWNQPLSTPRGSRRSAANLKRMQENVDRFAKAKGV